MLRIAALYTYPLKACAAVSHTQIELTPHGLHRDRTWMVVDADTGRFLSQRQLGALARLRATWDADTLHIEHPALPHPLLLPHDTPGDPREVSIWKDTLHVLDAGQHAADWISQAAGQPARLVRIDPHHRRTVPTSHAPEDTTIAFPDAFPLLLASQASLDDLNSRLTDPVTMLRFRPNVVLTGCAPFDEDRWTGLRAPSGAAMLRMRPCVRCRVVQLDPATGDLTGKEPLATLAAWRHDPDLGGPTFGCNYTAPTPGLLRVGDLLEPL